MRLIRTPAAHRHASAAHTRIAAVVAAAVAIAIAVPAWGYRYELGLASAGSPEARPRPAALTETAGHGDHTGAGATDGKPEGRQRIDTGAAPTSGPITELDRQLLIKVRQANLWELPAGRLAQHNSANEPVRRAGLHLIDGHSRLDQIVREISDALGLAIPDEASAEQQAWVRQLKNSRGEKFDRFFANQLRNAHGKVFVVIAQVRSTTQNSVIRDLAIEANIAVSDHLQVLEDTGLVERSTFDDVASAVIKP